MPCTQPTIPCLCLLSAVAACVAPVSAQDTSQWQPIDQAVGDLDLKSNSTRRVEQGIGQFGQSGALYQRPDNGQGWFLNGFEITQQYQMRRPGFTAWVDRPDYLVQDTQGELSLNNAPAIDGEFIDLLPPNTVFDLSNAAQQVFIPYYDDIVFPVQRVNTRIDGWADTEADPARAGTPRPVAHKLPPHLMQRRAERRAQEAATDASEAPADASTPDDVTDAETPDDAGHAPSTDDTPVPPSS